uniref:Uncharacterized protein n=1 Tax=Globodera rostochiensis TaxID=31243 RepID=A0A914GYS6_GLORO
MCLSFSSGDVRFVGFCEWNKQAKVRWVARLIKGAREKQSVESLMRRHGGAGVGEAEGDEQMSRLNATD